jgi:prepilin-type N-terminal cleavage/methylation domain-containing protein
MGNGYTLTELLVVLGLLSLVTGVLATTIYQFYTVTNWGNSQMVVDADLRNAGLWLMRDGNESKVFTGTLGCNSFVFDTGRGTLYTYTRSGNTLSRLDSTTGQTLNVARRVTDVQCPPGAATGTVAVTMVSTSGKVSSSASFTMTMRVAP